MIPETKEDTKTDTSPATSSTPSGRSVVVTAPTEGKKEIPENLCLDRYLQELVMDASFACVVEGIGTFLLFVDGKVYHFYIIQPEGSVPTSWDVTNIMNESPTSSGFKGLIPLDTSNICLLHNDDTTLTLFNTLDHWVHFRYKQSDSKVDEWQSRVARLYLDGHDIIKTGTIVPTLRTSSGFSSLRKYGRTDCRINCSDGKSIPFHMIVLASQWTLLHNLVAEKPQTDSVDFKYPSSLVELMVSYFYDEQKPLEFMDAVGLLRMAEDCELPELLTLALRRVKQEDMSVHQALAAWRQLGDRENKSLVAHIVVREYCAARIQDKLSMLEGSKEAQEMLKEMDQAELIRLYNDMSKATGAEEKRRKERSPGD